MFLQIKPLLCTKTHCIQHSWHKPATPKTMQKQGKAGVPRRQNDAKPQVGPRTGTRRMFCPFCESLITTGRGYDGLLLSSQDVQCQLNSSISPGVAQLHLVIALRCQDNPPISLLVVEPLQSSRQVPRYCYWQCLLRRLSPPVFVSSGTFCIAVPPRKPKGVGSPKD